MYVVWVWCTSEISTCTQNCPHLYVWTCIRWKHCLSLSLFFSRAAPLRSRAYAGHFVYSTLIFETSRWWSHSTREKFEAKQIVSSWSQLVVMQQLFSPPVSLLYQLWPQTKVWSYQATDKTGVKEGTDFIIARLILTVHRPSPLVIQVPWDKNPSGSSLFAFFLFLFVEIVLCSLG